MIPCKSIASCSVSVTFHTFLLSGNCRQIQFTYQIPVNKVSITECLEQIIFPQYSVDKVTCKDLPTESERELKISVSLIKRV